MRLSRYLLVWILNASLEDSVLGSNNLSLRTEEETLELVSSEGIVEAPLSVEIEGDKRLERSMSERDYEADEEEEDDEDDDDDDEDDSEDSEVNSSDSESSSVSTLNESRQGVPISAHMLHGILLDAGDMAMSFLTNPSFQIPHDETFASLASSYFYSNNYTIFVRFMERFNFYRLDDIQPLWDILHLCRNDFMFFIVILSTQNDFIVANFRSFWYEMLYIDIVRSETETSNIRCKTLHQSFRWAFQYFCEVLNEKGRPHNAFASFCIFNLLLDDKDSPYPKSLIKEILILPGIELNFSVNGCCMALYLLGLPKLPEYYHNLILSETRLDVNYLVPPMYRRCRHIVCYVPEMPLFLHSLIYLNFRALRILWFHPNLKVLPLIMPFFRLIRLALMCFFFLFWDSKDMEQRNIA